MNFVHSKSQECTKSELDLFSVPPKQVSLEKGHWIDQQPVSSVSDGDPITFLSQKTKADGTDLDADEKVGVVNNFLRSLFKQVDVFFKRKASDTGHRDLLITLLNYGPAAKKSQLTAALFYKDTAGKIDTADPTRAETRALIGGGGGVNIHIFLFCPTNFF